MYLKDSEEIIQILNVMEAHKSLMELENIRIIKEMRNSANRQSNCMTLPILIKWCVRQARQVEDIRYIEETIGLEQLAPALREMAQVRLDNPDVSLQELGTYLDPPVGKSGVNHRLRKLKEIAEGLRTEEGE
ncbi:MAG: DNA-binding protein WhiA [Eubacterium ramulus]